MHLLYIGLGGFAGAILRYSVGILVTRFTGQGFPYGTLAVNLIGSFLLGLLSALGAKVWSADPHFKLMVLVGFLGSFTTFSTFMADSFTLLEKRGYLLVLLNLFGSMTAGLALFAIGLALGKLVTR